jgi:hypothetical protein
MRIDLVAKAAGGNSSGGQNTSMLADFDLFELLGLSNLPNETKDKFLEQIFEQVLRMVFLRLNADGKLSAQSLEELASKLEIKGQELEVQESLVAQVPGLETYIVVEMQEYKLRALQNQLETNQSEAAGRLLKALEQHDRAEFIKAYDLYALEREGGNNGR